MSQLKHDALGFLTGGDPINLRELAATVGRMAGDIRDIRNLLHGQAGAARAAGRRGADRAPGVPGGRSGLPQAIPPHILQREAANSTKQRPVQPVSPHDASVPSVTFGAVSSVAKRAAGGDAKAQPQEVATPASPFAGVAGGRDKRGRFQSGGGGDEAAAAGGEEKGVKAIASRLVSAVC